MTTQPSEVAQAAPIVSASAEGLIGPDGKIFQGWRTAVASAIGLCVGPSSLMLFTFGSFVVPLQMEFGWSIGSLAAGATIINGIGIIGAVSAGYLVDRINSRKMVLWSLPVFALGIAAMSQITPNIESFYCAIVLAGVCGLGLWPVTYNRATASWFERRLGLGLGVGNIGPGVGAAILPAVIQFVIAEYGWRTAYVVLGMIPAIVWPLMLVLFYERRDLPRPKGGEVEPVGDTYKEARATPAFWIVITSFALLGVISSSTLIQFARILVDTGMTPAATAGLQSLMGISLIVARLFIGWLADRVPVSRIMFAVCVAAAVGVGLLAAGSPSGTAVVSAVAIGALFGAEFDILAFLIPRYFGRKSFGAIYGTVYAVFQFSGGVAVFCVGMARDVFGSYMVPLSVVAALSALCAILFLLLPAYRFVPSDLSAR